MAHASRGSCRRSWRRSCGVTAMQRGMVCNQCRRAVTQQLRLLQRVRPRVVAPMVGVGTGSGTGIPAHDRQLDEHEAARVPHRLQAPRGDLDEHHWQATGGVVAGGDRRDVCQ